MRLFNLSKKKEEKTPACACQCGCPTAETHCSEAIKEVAGAAVGIRSIKILGAGCASCHALLENTKKAAAGMELDVEVEYVTDMAKIASYGVMSIPALVINEKVVAMGKVLKSEDVATILKEVHHASVHQKP